MLCVTQVMSFLAGYFPIVLHVINTLKNFRSRWEKLASTFLFLHCGLLEDCSEAGHWSGSMSGCLFSGVA